MGVHLYNLKTLLDNSKKTKYKWQKYLAYQKYQYKILATFNAPINEFVS